jgi:hypothetical protein
MTPEVLLIAVLAGLANYAFRYLPIRLDRGTERPDGILARFLAATGPAAIATLFVASILPALRVLPTDAAPLAAGVAAVLAVFGVSRSVAGATFAGALAYGAMFWALG